MLVSQCTVLLIVEPPPNRTVCPLPLSRDGTVRIWGLQAHGVWHTTAILKGLPGPACHLALSPDSTQVKLRV